MDAHDDQRHYDIYPLVQINIIN